MTVDTFHFQIGPKATKLHASEYARNPQHVQHPATLKEGVKKRTPMQEKIFRKRQAR